MVFNPNILLAVSIIWLVVLTYFIFRLTGHYNRLTKGISKTTLSQILEKILKSQEISDQKINELFESLGDLKKDNLKNIQKFGLLRFNPFANIGGDQSFIIALLDGMNDGILVTSLTSRAGTRWYSKTIKNGKGVEYELSEEEKEVIKKAQKP